VRPGSAIERSPERPAAARPATAPRSGGAMPRDVKVGRNDPCPCGSGQKYKKCHGA
jgi:uncharacterized protein YecA (UPF0149 family)